MRRFVCQKPAFCTRGPAMVRCAPKKEQVNYQTYKKRVGQIRSKAPLCVACSYIPFDFGKIPIFDILSAPNPTPQPHAPNSLRPIALPPPNRPPAANSPPRHTALNRPLHRPSCPPVRPAARAPLGSSSADGRRATRTSRSLRYPFPKARAFPNAQAFPKARARSGARPRRHRG